MTQKLRRIIDESVGYGLALEGISALDVARSQTRQVDAHAHYWSSQASSLTRPPLA